MKHILSYVVCAAALAALVGCQQQPTSSSEPSTKVAAEEPTKTEEGASKSEETSAASLEVPTELKGDAYEYYGLGSDKPVNFSQTTQGQSSQMGSQTIQLVSVANGEATYKITRSGSLEGLGDQEMVLKKDGLYTTSMAGNKLKEPSLEIPATLTIGQSWTTKGTVTMADGRDLDQNMTYKVVSKKPLNTKMGTFEAFEISSTGTITASGDVMKANATIWLGKGIGLVKMNNTIEVKGQKQNITIEIAKGDS